MKIIFKSFLMVAAGFLMILPLKAQEVSSSQNIVKVNLFSPIARTGSFFFERVVADHMTMQLGFFYTGASIVDTKFRGFGITPEFRYYLSESRTGPSGTFIAPYLRYQSFNLSTDIGNDEATYSAMGGGLLIGYQRLLRNRISLEGFIGPSYSSGKVKVEAGNHGSFDTGFFDGFGVRFGVTAGVAF
jgi:hypothetical protein